MMNNLIKTKEGQNVVNARDLHNRLKTGRDFSNWIKGRIHEYGFTENEDYFIDNHRSPNLVSEKIRKGGFNKIDYLLTLDMAKELCMVERNSIGRQIRRYFIEIEKNHQTNAIIVPPPIEVYGVECLAYEYWLLQNKYSLMSGRVRGRIYAHRDYFHKHSSGKWYIAKEYAEALLSYRDSHKMLAGCSVIPKVEQIDLFETCEVAVFKRKE